MHGTIDHGAASPREGLADNIQIRQTPLLAWIGQLRSEILLLLPRFIHLQGVVPPAQKTTPWRLILVAE